MVGVGTSSVYYDDNNGMAESKVDEGSVIAPSDSDETSSVYDDNGGMESNDNEESINTEDEWVDHDDCFGKDNGGMDNDKSEIAVSDDGDETLSVDNMTAKLGGIVTFLRWSMTQTKTMKFHQLILSVTETQPLTFCFFYQTVT
jgi:hypothetical protein